MPAEFQTTFDGQIYQVTARELQSLKNKGYVLKPATDPEWLLKGIRFESVDLNHEENHGPAAPPSCSPSRRTPTSIAQGQHASER